MNAIIIRAEKIDTYILLRQEGYGKKGGGLPPFTTWAIGSRHVALIFDKNL